VRWARGSRGSSWGVDPDLVVAMAVAMALMKAGVVLEAAVTGMGESTGVGVGVRLCCPGQKLAVPRLRTKEAARGAPKRNHDIPTNDCTELFEHLILISISSIIYLDLDQSKRLKIPAVLRGHSALGHRANSRI